MVGISFWLFVLGSVSCTQPPIYQTANGQVRGIIRRSQATNQDVQIFYGIPYAKPPVGNLRFENPEDPVDWKPSVRDATTLHARCYQYNSAQVYVNFHQPNTPGESEDCLYLNIFVPTPITSTNKAVLVYIHGGKNVLGSAHMYDGDELASVGDIIVVTVNYRLGVLGFLGSGEADFPGNYALMDQIKALKWVKDNIANFGGNHNQVTLAGDNTAAWNVGRHLVSPLAAGLFRAVVSLGGSPTFKAAFKALNKNDSQEEIKKIAEKVNCRIGNLTSMKTCLKTISALELSKKYAFQHNYLPFAVLSDSNFFAIESATTYNAQNYLLGYNTDYPISFVTQRKEWSDIANDLKEFGLVRSDVDVTEIIRFEYTDWRNPKDVNKRVRSFLNKRSSSYHTTPSTIEEVIQEKYGPLLTVSDATVKVPAVQAANLLNEKRLDVFLFEWSHTAPAISQQRSSAPNNGIDLHHYLFGDPFGTHHYYKFGDIDNRMSRALMEAMGNYVKSLIFAPTAKITDGSNWKYGNKKTYLNFAHGNTDIEVRRNPVPRAVRFWEIFLPKLCKRLVDAKSN